MAHIFNSYSQTITIFIAYLYDPRFRGKVLSASEGKKEALVFVKVKYTEKVLPLIMKFLAKARSF